MISRQQSLEQERATNAWKAVKTVGKGYQEGYKALASGAAADIQINGLGQTLAFWCAKANRTDKKGNPVDNEHRDIYAHVSNWVKDRLLKEGMTIDPPDLLQWLMEGATTDQYRRATSETITYLIWLKRFAEAELKGNPLKGKGE